MRVSLVPSRPHPPVENVWWSDLNFLHRHLSHLECEMSNQIAERTINSRYIIKVQNGRLDFYSEFANFVRKRELCGPALGSFKD